LPCAACVTFGSRPRLIARESTAWLRCRAPYWPPRGGPQGAGHWAPNGSGTGRGEHMDRRIGLAIPAVALGVALLAAGSLATGTSPPVAAEASPLGVFSVDGASVDAVAPAAGNSTLNCTRPAAGAPIHCTASNPDGLK